MRPTQTRAAIVLLPLALLAFAGNSLLARAALRDGLIDPVGFTGLRLFAGAVTLAGILLLRGGVTRLLQFRPGSSVSLFVYAIAFSVAYIYLDAGFGALVLFGVVQLTMFIAALRKGQSPTSREWIGMVLAFCGLVWLLSPGSLEAPAAMAGVMAIAGVSWAAYTLIGRGAEDATVNTAQAFVGASLMVAPVLAFWPHKEWSAHGVALAALSGSLTSGLGYVVWYAVLPALSRTAAAVVQLAVPPVTLLLSALFLGEDLTFRLAAASVIIIFGIGLSVTARKEQRP